MRMTALARRYAGALFQAAKEADVIDKVESDLGLITYSIQTIPRLEAIITHPLIPAAKKKEIVADIFKGKIEEVTLLFLNLLIDKRRGEILEEVEAQYVVLANDFRGVVPVTAVSAVTLTPDEQKRLQAKLEEFTSKKVELSLQEDPSLIGGLTVKIGDTVIDGSVTGYLASLKRQLLG